MATSARPMTAMRDCEISVGSGWATEVAMSTATLRTVMGGGYDGMGEERYEMQETR